MSFQMGHPPLYVTFSVCSSVRSSVAHNISRTVHHLIIIVGTRVKWWYLQVFFWFFEILMKNNSYMCHVPYLRKSIAVYISGTIYHVIVIYGTLVYYDYICRVFGSLAGLGGWGGGGGTKGQKMVKIQNEKEICLWCSISQESYHMIFIYDTYV